MDTLQHSYMGHISRYDEIVAAETMWSSATYFLVKKNTLFSDPIQFFSAVLRGRLNGSTNVAAWFH